MNTFFFGLLAASARAEITFPKEDSDLLIAAPSLRRSPVAPGAGVRETDVEKCDFGEYANQEEALRGGEGRVRRVCAAGGLGKSFSPVDSARSEPARSIKFISDEISFLRPAKKGPWNIGMGRKRREESTLEQVDLGK
jgi:hypothetical protein